jgi:hypothetical protein
MTANGMAGRPAVTVGTRGAGEGGPRADGIAEGIARLRRALRPALSTLPARQRRALAAAVPALDALAQAIDRLADTPAMPAEPGS